MTDFLPVKTKGFLAHTMEQQVFSYWGMGDTPPPPASLAIKLLILSSGKISAPNFYFLQLTIFIL